MRHIYLFTPPDLDFEHQTSNRAGNGPLVAVPVARDNAMFPLLECRDLSVLSDRIRDACSTTSELIAEVISLCCPRVATMGGSEPSRRLARLTEANAWTDVALALIQLELPQWQLRRIEYDGGEWYCALSRFADLPTWLDRSVQANHSDFSLALLSVLIEAKDISVSFGKPSAPSVQSKRPADDSTMCGDNFA
jgi:hypothetical protein